ncbi:DegT/DnrJ/EryC1/StrS family aminotransferase [Armatimonas sp.]|uniref:DegT/DnrJ/EryC1/StrS family aminotransferase n=1 Tax=Armatimonas sp. TaxID=1872638 RepID=UPI00286C1571|nr:DegT/DnrJ/EryC1/StrS family aminotransferase [Armatimonas sp.]
MTIPFAEFKSQYATLKPELDAALQSVLEAGWFVLGEQGKAFEQEFGAWLGTKTIGVANGTDAIALALRALGVGAGDEVITTPMTAFPTAAAIRQIGAIPIFADIQADTLCLDPQKALAKIGPKTKAIVPVHLYGQAADLGPLLECGIPILEDCAQSHGTRWQGRLTGTIGAIAAFSFYPTKNLGAYGDGGAVATNDPALAATVGSLRNYGEGTQRYEHLIEGVNSRLDEIQAAILRVKLRHLDASLARRRELATLYNQLLRGVELPIEAVYSHNTWHLYVIRTAPEKRDTLRQHLAERGVGTQIHYPIPQNRQPALAHLDQQNTCPISNAEAERILSLPLYPELADEQITYIAEQVAAFF